MGRDLPTGFATAASAKVLYPAFMVDLDWPGGMVRAWNGCGSIVWDGNTYLGLGEYGAISKVTESTDVGANGLTLSLLGIPASLIPEILANDAQGRNGRVYLALLTADGALAADPYLFFDGFINVTPFKDGGDKADISVQLEKELIDRRLQNRRGTHEDQQIDFPGDGFFRFAAALSEQTFNWGGKTVSGTSGTAGAGATGGQGGNDTSYLA